MRCRGICGLATLFSGFVSQCGLDGPHSLDAWLERPVIVRVADRFGWICGYTSFYGDLCCCAGKGPCSIAMRSPQVYSHTRNGDDHRCDNLASGMCSRREYE